LVYKDEKQRGKTGIYGGGQDPRRVVVPVKMRKKREWRISKILT
jgi:hypothetical protein